jgi:hypothetical protein
MATTTIELPVDESILRRAELAAAQRHTTVADMLGTALQAIGDLEYDASHLPPITRAALGMAKGLPDRPYKELLVDALMEKYGPLK